MKETYLHMKSGKTYQIDPESVISESGQKVHLDKLNHWDALTGAMVYVTKIEQEWMPSTKLSKRNVVERKSEIIFSLDNIDVVEINDNHAE